METSILHFLASEGPPHSGPEVVDPVHLLCRAVRLAPAGYQYFELVAVGPDSPLKIAWSVFQMDEYSPSACGSATFTSSAELAAAMLQFSPLEHLVVQMLPDQQSIIIRRVD